MRIPRFIILALLASLPIHFWVPSANRADVRPSRRLAQIQLYELKNGLEMLALDTGTYPGPEEGLTALIRNPGRIANWQGPYISSSKKLIDPWGHPYQYRVRPGHGSYDLFSYSRDGRPGGQGLDEDITYSQR